MKSWADHCSSDEESFNEDTPMEKFEDTDDEVEPVKELEQQMDQATIEPEVTAPPPAPRTYDFPAGPPYTLFVGNLSYSIKDGDELGDALANLVKDRLNQDIKVIKGRIGFDRHNPNSTRHKGFGYVEVGSLEEMKLTLELNMDPGAQLAGRKVQLDTANHTPNHNNNKGGGNRRASAPEVDGRSFRQGKFNKNNAGRGGGGGRRQSEATTPAPPASQRPSLKLAPRTKPLDSKPVPAAGSKADIFGGAKPRDTNPWNNKPKPAPPAATEPAPAPAPAPAATESHKHGSDPKHNHSNNHNHHNNNHRRSSGRGGGRGGGGNDKGRGRGGGGRGAAGATAGGDHKGGKGGKNHNKNANKAPPAEKKAPVAPPAAAAAPAPAEEKRASNNRFAAFAFDSDSD